MPTLVLPPRYTPDSNALATAAAQVGWNVERLASWRVPDHLRFQHVVLYGEPLFAAVVGSALGIVLLEPPLTWLADLPEAYRRRRVDFTTLADARQCPTARECSAQLLPDPSCQGLGLQALAVRSDDLATGQTQWRGRRQRVQHRVGAPSCATLPRPSFRRGCAAAPRRRYRSHLRASSARTKPTSSPPG